MFLFTYSRNSTKYDEMSINSHYHSVNSETVLIFYLLIYISTLMKSLWETVFKTFYLAYESLLRTFDSNFLPDYI